MTPDEDRITRLYDAFNDRDFDRCVEMLATDVVWPDEVEDGLVRGREAVRIYFSETTAPLLAHYDVISLHTAADGRIEVLTRQTIASAADGSLWSSTRVLHRFIVRGGLIAGMESEQDTPATTFLGIDVLLSRLHAALTAGDLETIVACYAPTARFADNLEGGEIEGVEAIRAHFIHLLETVRLEIGVVDYEIEPDDRVRAHLHLVTRGPAGGLWQDDILTVWYRLENGLIVEQDVDDSGRDGNGR